MGGGWTSFGSANEIGRVAGSTGSGNAWTNSFGGAGRLPDVVAVEEGPTVDVDGGADCLRGGEAFVSGVFFADATLFAADAPGSEKFTPAIRLRSDAPAGGMEVTSTTGGSSAISTSSSSSLTGGRGGPSRIRRSREGVLPEKFVASASDDPLGGIY